MIGKLQRNNEAVVNLISRDAPKKVYILNSSLLNADNEPKTVETGHLGCAIITATTAKSLLPWGLHTRKFN